MCYPSWLHLELNILWASCTSNLTYLEIRASNIVYFEPRALWASRVSSVIYSELIVLRTQCTSSFDVIWVSCTPSLVYFWAWCTPIESWWTSSFSVYAQRTSGSRFYKPKTPAINRVTYFDEKQGQWRIEFVPFSSSYIWRALFDGLSVASLAC